MRSRICTAFLSAAFVIALAPATASAKLTPAEAAKLDGPELNCMGGTKAANKDGSIPQWGGQWVGKWPGMKGEHGYEPGPYAAEKPLFTINAQNYSKYAAKLTAGQKELFKKYPQNYSMIVYPTHRDFGNPQWACDVTKKNALESELVNGGKGVTGTGGGPTFPIPKSGLEAIWSVKTAYRAWTEKGVLDIANVYGNGTIGWGRNRFFTMNLMNDPKTRRSLTDRINSYFYTAYLLPERDKGLVAVGFQPNDYSKDATQAWQYLPGTRRVRQAPEVGYDYPVPPAGLHTTDEDYGFNGSPERYNWKLLGKQEIYLPFHNFKINDPTIKYKELITPNTINPKYVRYELRRVWVLEANLIEGLRHQYKTRRIYVDEDSWQVLWADHYDGRDQLWRVAVILYFYSQESSAHHRGVQLFHDLTAGVYEATNLLNERKPEDWWRVNTPMTPGMFTPEAAARAGH